MAACEYCDDELERTGGKLFIRADGTRLYFCSGKCQTNWANNQDLEYAEH